MDTPTTQFNESGGARPGPGVAPLAAEIQCRHATRRSNSNDAFAAADTADAVAAAPAPISSVPANLLSEGEIVILLIKPSLLYIVLSSIGFIFAALFIAMLLLVLAMNSQSSNVTWTPRDATTFAMIIIGLRLVWQSLDWWNQTYILTDRRVLAISGVTKRRIFESPLRNIHHLAIVMPFRERLFGLGSIAFATTGSHRYDATWLMVRDPAIVHRKVLDTIDRYGRNHPV